VENPLSLTFEQIKEMDSKRIFAVLECPGFFTDEGYWRGVEVRKLLEKAGISEEALSVRFTGLGGYQRSLPIEEVVESDGLLAAYHFQDKEFPEVHGYPLRIVASGKPGYIWVKWLAEIEVHSSDVNADSTMTDK